MLLGNFYLNNFLYKGQDPGEKYPLELVMDESCGAMRLKEVPPLNKMYGKYWYRSGTNKSMENALKDVVNSILPFKKKGNWLDIACNDGTLLSRTPKEFDRYGVDPCEGDIEYFAKMSCEYHYKSFFKAELFGYTKFDVITTIAMFYDIEDTDEFCNDVHEVLKDDGLWVIQMSYTPLMVIQNAFDNICHEHVYYHTFKSMATILNRNGFTIADCTLNDVNGGSFRLFVKKDGFKHGSKPYQDVCNFRIDGIFYAEHRMNLNNIATWDNWFTQIKMLKSIVTEFIKKEVAAGKTVMGYGASTKGNTLLQYFELDSTLITAIAEKQSDKYGLHTPGTNIPIISEYEMREAKPDYLLILPWHFIDEFKEREKDYLSSGGKFIVTMPIFQVI